MSNRTSRHLSTRRFVDPEDDYTAGTPATVAPHIITIIWRRKFIIIAFVALSIIGGWITFKKITPTYSSGMKLHLREAMPRIASVGQVTTAVPTFSVNTEFEIIKSTAVLERALQQPGIKSIPFLRASDNPVGVLQDLIQVNAGKADDIILISVDTTNPNDAAAIANGVAQAYIEYNAEQQLSTSVNTLKDLKQQKAKTEEEYDSISKELIRMRRDNGILTLDASKGNIQTQTLAGLQEQLQDAEKKTTDAKVIAERLDELKDYPGPLKAFIASESTRMGFSGNLLTDDAAQKREFLIATLNDLEERHYGVNHPEVGRIRGLLAIPPSSRGDDQYVEAFRMLTAQNVATAVKSEEEIRSQFEKQRDLALTANAQEQQYAQLQDRASRDEKLLGILDSSIKEVDLNGVSGSLTVSILDAAKPNSVPVSPKRERILGLAGVIGLALGMSMALLRDLLDLRLRSLAEIEDTLGTRILGTVPTLGKRVHPMISGKTVDTRPVSDVAEAYRSIRTTLFLTRETGGAQTILVTSATSGEGKTTTVSNLAIAAAQMGRKVLLIDADCRMPSLHMTFKVSDGLEKGLSSVVTKGVSAEEAIRPTGIDNLDILTSGPLNSRPAEMLNGPEFKNLLRNMAERYDHIFIDSPPVLPVTDACVMSAQCDVTLLVLRAEKSTRTQTLRARDSLEGVGGRLLGVVVNDAPRRQAQYGCDFELYPAADETEVRRRVKRRRPVQRTVPALTAASEKESVNSTD